MHAISKARCEPSWLSESGLQGASGVDEDDIRTEEFAGYCEVVPQKTSP
jgi:hypothetical protein